MRSMRWFGWFVAALLAAVCVQPSEARASDFSWTEPWLGEDWLMWSEGCPLPMGRGPVLISPSFMGVFPSDTREVGDGSGFMVDVGCFMGPALEVGVFVYNRGGARVWLVPELTANFIELNAGPTFEFNTAGDLEGIGGQVALSAQFWVGGMLLMRLTPERDLVYELVYRFGF